MTLSRCHKFRFANLQSLTLLLTLRRLAAIILVGCGADGLTMAVYDLYSKRKKRTAMAGKAEVYRYDVLPQKLRVQIVGICRTAIGPCFRQPDLYSAGQPPTFGT
jgi:hypothetical protein